MVERRNVKTALITGATGQDGGYLAELLLQKGYTVHGMKRRTSLINTDRVDHLMADPRYGGRGRFQLHYGDMTDSTNLIRLVQETQPDEVYNLAAQSHVQVSFESPEYTANADALGTLRLLEAIRILGLARKTRFYQASTSELYGKVHETPQTERTPFWPRSPYAVAKLYAYWITVNYREAYGFHASNGILFNHEGPTRGETFVTRKVTRAVAAIKCGRQERVELGNLNAVRDWGHARDYAEGMWRIVQQNDPGDYVLATGEGHTVREFVAMAFRCVGVNLIWRGHGQEEEGVDEATGKVRVAVDKRYFRPTEVDTLLGDASLARKRLGWKPSVSFEELVREMVDSDLARLEKGTSSPPIGRSRGNVQAGRPRVFRADEMKYTLFFQDSGADQLGLSYVDSPEQADIIIARKTEALRRYSGNAAKLVIWTHEPRYSTEDSSPASVPGIDKPVYVMNAYTGMYTDPFKYFPRTVVDFDANMEQHRARPHRAIILATHKKADRAKIRGSLKYDLYIKRQAVAAALQSRGLCDVMGRNWPASCNPLGESRGDGWQKEKSNVLKGYAFNLAYENTFLPFYVTEKIWDAIIWGCLPIYHGTKGIYDVFPPGSFVDGAGRRPEEIADEVQSMSPADRAERYAMCLRAYLDAHRLKPKDTSARSVLSRTKEFLVSVLEQ